MPICIHTRDAAEDTYQILNEYKDYLVKPSIMHCFSENEKYIKDTSVILPPDWCEPIRCAISSYNETLTFTFASNIEEQYLQKSFIKELNNLKIKYTIENNDINPLKKEV